MGWPPVAQVAHGARAQKPQSGSPGVGGQGARGRVMLSIYFNYRSLFHSQIIGILYFNLMFSGRGWGARGLLAKVHPSSAVRRKREAAAQMLEPGILHHFGGSGATYEFYWDK